LRNRLESEPERSRVPELGPRDAHSKEMLSYDDLRLFLARARLSSYNLRAYRRICLSVGPSLLFRRALIVRPEAMAIGRSRCIEAAVRYVYVHNLTSFQYRFA
jgi:hypothetical protein